MTNETSRGSSEINNDRYGEVRKCFETIGSRMLLEYYIIWGDNEIA